MCVPSIRRRRDAPAYDTPASYGTPQIGAKVAEIITKLTLMSAGVDGEFPFTMVVDDPSGNSFVENPSAPNKDPDLTVSPPDSGHREMGHTNTHSCLFYSIVDASKGGHRNHERETH